MPFQSQHIRSTITRGGQLQLSLGTEEIADPGPDEVVVRIEASPINPSDLGLLFGPADMSTAVASGTDVAPTLTAEVPERMLAGVRSRLDEPMLVGNEGAGVVVATGDSDGAKTLAGKTVSVIGGAMYGQYRKLHVGACQPLPEGTTAADGASWFVNPMTALCMVETMRLEKHTALVHTAAASNLGQMLTKLCLEEDISLVNIVRRPAQEELLRGLGAKHVVNSTAESYRDDLGEALVETGATLGFDAIGGGKCAGQILGAMETAQTRGAKSYSRYGSTVYKQVYIYGALDGSPTVLNRSFGMTWGLGGWLLTPTLQRVGGERIAQLRERVAKGLKGTFQSRYTKQVNLAQALQPSALAGYGKQATGEKYLVTPNA